MKLLRWLLTESGRHRGDLALLLVAPAVLVTVRAATLTQFAHVLGGTAAAGSIRVAMAGWAAALFAGIVGLFQANATADADRRLATASGRPGAVAAARVTTTAALALLAVCGALVGAVLGGGLGHPVAALVATVAAALTYASAGLVLGTFVTGALEGSLALLLVWLVDVFSGPAMGSRTALTDALPLHFPTSLALAPAAAPAGSWGGAVIWGMGGIALAAGVQTRRLRSRYRRGAVTRGRVDGRVAVTGGRVGRPVAATSSQGGRGAVTDGRADGRVAVSGGRVGRRRVATGGRVVAVLRAGIAEYRRTPLLWVLLVAVPVVFVLFAIAITPDRPTLIIVDGAAGGVRVVVGMTHLHAAVMVPIAVGFLAGLAGLFIVLGSADADRRLILAGARPIEVLTGRLVVIAAASVLAVGAAMAASAAGIVAHSWFDVALGAVAVALPYAMIGVIVGPLAGRTGGAYLMLTLPFVDIGIGQDVMFGPIIPAWGRYLPGHAGVSALLDGAFGRGVPVATLGIAAAWTVGFGIVAAVVFHRITRPASN